MLPETQLRYLTVPEALDKLAALGDHHHIATYLAERDLKGACNNPAYCPVARYLTEETGFEVGVGKASAHVWHGPEATEYDALPEPVRNFVEHFDAREYPELEIHLLDIIRMDLARAPRAGECA